jgi:hypothetical protein
MDTMFSVSPSSWPHWVIRYLRTASSMLPLLLAAGCGGVTGEVVNVYRSRVVSRLIAVLVVGLAVPLIGEAQDHEQCVVLCVPELKIEPTITFENLGARARVEADGMIERTRRETVFELIFALGVPTSIPRVGLTFEAIFIPFEGTSEHPFTGATAEGLGHEEIRDNPVEIEAEINLDLLDSEQTGGWLSSHFDIVDKFSPGERPDAASVYTHKLNFELDTALYPFNWLGEGRWLRNMEAEVSIDYVATGLPREGDVIGNERFLNDASPWSASIVFVFPLAPLDP